MNPTATKTLSATLLALLCATASAPALSTPIQCGVNDTHGATANGAFADDCNYYSDSNIANPTDITNQVNAIWGAGGEFSYAGKYNNGTGSEIDGLLGFTLQVTQTDDNHKFHYQLIVDDSWVGKTVDWVLGIKQSNDSFVSYLFTDVTLGIDGGFDNYWVNPAGKSNNDYSFAAGFIRSTTSVQVPEPGTLALLGMGLLGMAARARLTRT